MISTKVLTSILMSTALLAVSAILEQVDDLDLPPTMVVLVTGVLTNVSAYLKAETNPSGSARAVIHDELVGLEELQESVRS